MCTGLAPFVDWKKVEYDPAKGSVEQQRTAAVDYYRQIGTATTKLSVQLKSIPAPTIEGGSELAGAVVTGFAALARSPASWPV